MRIGRAHHRRVGLAIEVEIVAESALAGDEPRILHPPDWLSDGAEVGLGHGYRFVDGRRKTLAGGAI